MAVDFEGPWWEQLGSAGFDQGRPAVVASSGVVMYLSKEATEATLALLAGLATGSTLVASFMVPSELVEPREQRAIAGARNGMQAAAGSVSLFTPEEIVAVARRPQDHRLRDRRSLLELRVGALGPDSRISHTDDFDQSPEAVEVVRISRVERQPVGMRRGGDEQVGNAATMGTTDRQDRGDDLTVTTGSGGVERDGVEGRLHLHCSTWGYGSLQRSSASALSRPCTSGEFEYE